MLVPLRFGKRTLSKEISELAISRNMLVIVVYVLTIFVATVVSLHVYITSFGLEEVIFELVSALSNVGLTVGFISAASPLSIKWIFILLMWLGRLEIVPVIIIAMGFVKGIQEDITKQKPAPLVYDHQELVLEEVHYPVTPPLPAVQEDSHRKNHQPCGEYNVLNRTINDPENHAGKRGKCGRSRGSAWRRWNLRWHICCRVARSRNYCSGKQGDRTEMG